VVLAVLVVVVAGMRAASSILVPLLLSIFIAVILTPAYVAMNRRGVPSSIALIVVILVLVGASFGFITIVGRSLTDFSTRIPTYQTQLQEQTQLVIAWLKDHGMEDLDPAAIESLSPRRAMQFVGGIVGALGGLLKSAFLIVLITVFILLESRILPAKLKALPGMTSGTLTRLEMATENVRRYMGLKTVVSLLTGTLVAVMLALLKVDYPIMLGTLAFMLNYVPSIGSFIAAIPGVALALLGPGLGPAAIALVGYIAINVAIGNGLEPKIIGDQLGLSPLVVLVSLIFWGWVLGPIGMLLSVPLTMAVKIALETDDEMRWIAILMGSRPHERQPAGS